MQLSGVSGGMWKPSRRPEGLETPSRALRGVWLPSGRPEGLQTPPRVIRVVWKPLGIPEDLTRKCQILTFNLDTRGPTTLYLNLRP